MSDTSADFREHFPDLVRGLFQQAFDDWNEMIGFEVSAGRAHLRVLRSSKELVERAIGGGVLLRTRVEGASSGPVLFVFPQDLVAAVVRKAMMLPGAGSANLDPENESHCGAAAELMNLFCGSTTRALEETRHRKLRISQSVEHLSVELAPAVPPGFDESESLFCVQVEVEAEGCGGRAWCLLPEGVAAAFGDLAE